ncbi:MAG: hypothetical protein A3G33_11560 [Omnitrophica bacterium RIFCSPLOWO2_12_FULL_44_17]|uniref:Peptidase MA-like domain-containing protein n=1 Tax=Candidatus Danuiimicrobium aquiferis TaxID=1801832 RepID=A0A1G1KRR9_9BACT|nr:MAG: hypothetical protein A3B72_09400 [Omnitrophica bacterium RIFCSPHIGHO2_02_FULL_45_28]OGW91225.1 MAG: hypothetical protein A3E74_02930 [Omnitrophica bacterium RIFCSPHIGHO2_12_FULL_44_12]OGW95626.1 MAG: hypothetical protein A3G33_11560 [Omnitrophica bacterium RIFCSPLOWO2_12_FULL_44_17]
MKKSQFYFMVMGFFLLVHGHAYGGQSDYATLVKKAEVLIGQGAYQAGISVLETVLVRDPKNSDAINSYLTACDEYSKKLIEQGKFDQAGTYLKKAESLMQKVDEIPAREFSREELKAKSRIKREVATAKEYLLEEGNQKAEQLVEMNSGRELYNQAVEHFNKHEFDVAEKILKESIELDQSNPYAYELLGDITNLNHDLDSAKIYYGKAFSLNSNPRVREKVEKLTREKEVDKTQQQYLDQYFIIRYRRGEKFEGGKIREVLREAYRTISQDYNIYPQYKIPVILYDKGEYQTVMGQVPHWSGGLYDGKIRLPAYSETMTLESIKRLAFHELTHAFVLDMSRMHAPVWLQEGLAQYEENKAVPINLALLEDAIKSQKLLGLDKIIFGDVNQLEASDALLFYLESFSLASAMVEKYRFYKVKQILTEIGEGKSFPDAFQSVTARSFDDFSSEWLRNLMGGKKKR